MTVNSGDPTTLIADYQQRCGGQATPSQACDILRSLVVAEVTTAFELIARSRDQRGVQEALAALDVVDEPVITIAAYRVLGAFPKTPGIADKVMPQLLSSQYVEVQRAAANVLRVMEDAAVAQVGSLWLRNHGNLPIGGPYEEYPDFPARYTSMGFPKYPGAEWFSPADSDRSIGWSTKDDAAAVTKWFTDSLHAEALDINAWIQVMGQELLQGLQGFDPATMTRMQQLMEKAMKGDQAAVAELQKQQKEMEDSNKKRDEATERRVDKVAMAADSQVAQARWIVAQKKGARTSRVVLVYPMPGLQRTAIQYAWDLSDYPSAWPETEPGR